MKHLTESEFREQLHNPEITLVTRKEIAAVYCCSVAKVVRKLAGVEPFDRGEIPLRWRPADVVAGWRSK
jgi:hypothetical protein